VEVVRQNPSKVTKAGGWLLLFAITLLVINPVMRLVGIVSSFGPVASVAANYPRFTITFAIIFACDVAMMVFSIAAGVAILRVRPSAVRLAKTFLLVNPLYLFVATVALGYSDLPAKANDAMNIEGANQVARTLIYTVVWTIYLHRSRRVRGTFAPPMSRASAHMPGAMPARKVSSL